MPRQNEQTVERLVPDKVRWKCEKNHEIDTVVRDHRFTAPTCETCSMESMASKGTKATRGQLLYVPIQVDASVTAHDDTALLVRLLDAVSPRRAGGGLFTQWCIACEQQAHAGPRACKCACHEARALVAGTETKAA
jgi:hypothetical protein